MRFRSRIRGGATCRRASFPKSLELPEPARLDDALQRIAAALAEPIASSCLISVSGRHVGTLADHPNCQLSDGDELLLLAPIAGG